MYRLGVKHPKAPHRPVICIGNLQVGGSGKTPVTRFVARTLLEIGRKVAVSCSGYGSPKSQDATFAPDGPLSAKEWGDEPAMLRWLEPELPLVVGRDRVAAAHAVHERMPGSVMLMDDGFQHLPLRKHLVILLDPEAPVNSRCLPAGPYREPRRHRSRADLVIPGRFALARQSLKLVDTSGVEARPERYAVLCALGRPEAFLADLEEAMPQSRPGPARLLPDHDPLQAGTLFNDLPPELPLVVTAKDWVKLRERTDILNRTFLIATYDLRLEPNEEFRSYIESRLAESR
jgi:tetraacyldisaccharide 4'-kinase